MGRNRAILPKFSYASARTLLITSLALVFVAGVFAVGSAEAQYNWHSSLPDLTDTDLIEIQTVTSRMLMETPEIEKGRWRNMKSGTQGEVTLTRSFESDGRICRELSHVIRYDMAGRSDRFTVIRCLHEDGRWMIEPD